MLCTSFCLAAKVRYGLESCDVIDTGDGDSKADCIARLRGMVECGLIDGMTIGPTVRNDDGLLVFVSETKRPWLRRSNCCGRSSPSFTGIR